EAWHRAGMRENKQNVFDDFIAAAEYLVKEKYSTPARIAIYGGSNGGLLVGACMTQRPELFGAVICYYPLLDMLRYHSFLVGEFWISEFGSSDNPADFPYLHAYSPYHHVADSAVYPATLLITGDADTRVDPLHARKMTARLQRASGAETPVLLRYHTRAGHAGGQPMRQIVDELVDVFSFLSWRVGLQMN
ncbi:MAG: prolyl oligopeptidase family serine peptidase, partial [Bacteroidota bacterium]|nr:prolyl oligopeptidase family serine peptidase [Bacteroidota bacterium]